MQNIQDKEFDQLFKDKFDGAEIDPVTDLWKGIETQLESRPRRIFPLWWIAAAAGCAAITAGLLFYHPDKAQSFKIVMDKPAMREEEKVVPQNSIVKQPVLSTVGNSVSPAFAANKINTSPVSVTPQPNTDADPKKELTVMQPLALVNHPDNKDIQMKQKKVGLPEPSVPEKVVLASADTSPEGAEEVTNENDSAADKKGIRNIGDLVNYVVDKVDKREEKFLQFKTEDDNSSLIAINIGIIKFNQKKTHK